MPKDLQQHCMLLDSRKQHVQGKRHRGPGKNSFVPIQASDGQRTRSGTLSCNPQVQVQKTENHISLKQELPRILMPVKTSTIMTAHHEAVWMV